jgi:hypothetical protein
MGFTDWTATPGTCPGDGCTTTSGAAKAVRPATGPIPGPSAARPGGRHDDERETLVLALVAVGVALGALVLARRRARSRRAR